MSEAVDLRSAQRWRAVKREFSELLFSEREHVLKKIIAEYRKRDRDDRVFTGLAGELHQLDALMTKLDRNITKAEKEVEHGI